MASVAICRPHWSPPGIAFACTCRSAANGFRISCAASASGPPISPSFCAQSSANGADATRPAKAGHYVGGVRLKLDTNVGRGVRLKLDTTWEILLKPDATVGGPAEAGHYRGG